LVIERAWHGLRPSCVSNGDHQSTFGPTKDSPLIPQKTVIKPQMFGVRLSFVRDGLAYGIGSYCGRNIARRKMG
jgi:hypothetical protein